MSIKTIFCFVVPVLLLPSSPFAKIPDPASSTVQVNTPSAGCQFRFRADGGLDELQVHAVIRDVWDVPVGDCLIRARVVSAGTSTEALCACTTCATQIIRTDADGIVDFVFRRIGGRGQLTVIVDELYSPNPPHLVMDSITIPFTSPDLNGSGSGADPSVVPPCVAAPASATDVLDLAIWASGLSPAYAPRSDFDCSGAPVGILDLAMWSGGLGKGCVPGCP